MKLIVKILPALATMLWATITIAQTPPASPDAPAMVCNISVPVNLYNGVASVNVPLYNAALDNGASLPIALQYTASGIRVDQLATSVGLGWILQAGGSIFSTQSHLRETLR